MTQTNGSLKNLSDFDFDVKARTRRGAGTRAGISDGYATIAVKGRNRKSNGHTLSISSYCLKNEVSPKLFALGQHKFSKREVIIVLDNERIESSAQVHHYAKSNQWQVGNANMPIRLFELMGIDIPDKPDTSMTFRFNMNEIKGQPKVYTVEPLSLTRIDSAGQVTVHQYKKVAVPA